MVRLNYIEIPILLKLTIPAGVVVPSIFIGPAIAFRAGVSGWYEQNGTKEDFDDDIIKDIKEDTKAVDFGLPMGVGLNIAAGPIVIIIEGRYTLGFIAIDKLTQDEKDAGETASDQAKDKNGCISIMGGIGIPLGG